MTRREDFAREYIRLRSELGEDWLAQIAINSTHTRVVHCGLRSRADMECIKESGGIIIGLVCRPELCVYRANTTSDATPKTPKTITEYWEKVVAEFEKGDDAINTAYCVRNADLVFDTARCTPEEIASTVGQVLRIEDNIQSPS